MNTKKIIYFGIGLLALSFSACNSMIEPAPSPSERIDTVKYTFSETFATGVGAFTQFNVVGNQNWTVSEYKYIMMNGNVNEVPSANESWLISPAITLPSGNTSVVTFDYVTRGFFDLTNEASIWVSEDYNTILDPSKATWTRINTVDPMVNSVGWTMSNAGDISLKAFKGKKVNIAFKYISSSSQAGIWQIKNFFVKDRLPVTLPYLEPFTSNKGKFVAMNVSGSQIWTVDTHGYATVSGYVGSVNYANEDWLISPQVDLTNVSHAKLSFNQVTRYFGNLKTEATIWYSSDYDEGLPNTGTWKQLKTYPFSESGNWTLTTSHELSLDSCAGKKVYIAFKYLSTLSKAGTWELNNFLVQEGIPSDIYFYEAFDSSLGSFTTDNKLGAQVWAIGSSSSGVYALSSGFANGVSNANEDWLISPTINLTGKTSAKLSFDHAINKGIVANMQTNHTLWLSADNGTTWEQITIPIYPAGNAWTFVNSGDITIPSKFMGISTFKFAFKYLCSTTESASWEIRNVILKP